MPDIYPMVVKNDLLYYPQEIKEQFLATGPLPLRDGTTVSPEEIWEFMTDEGPRKFPFVFTSNPNSPQRLPYYVDLISGLKLNYLVISRRFRVEKLRQQGKPLIYVQGGQTLEPYYAADVVPLRPGDMTTLACYYVAEGLNLRNKDWKKADIHEEGNRVVAYETCRQVTCHTAIRNGVVPVSLLAPYTRTRCSDVTFLVESHRSNPLKTESLLVDYPPNYERHKSWAVDYVAAGIRRLIAKLDEVTGRTTTDEEFRAQIRAHNRIRGLTREIVELFRSAAVPPTGSAMFYGILAMGKDCDADPVAAEHVLAQMRDEVRERVARSQSGAELAARPVRVFKCGSCFDPNLHKLDSAGGVLVGADDRWSYVWMPDVHEEGDPYGNYARGTLLEPYDLPTEERARWVVDQVKQSRADGLIFGYQWGCNFQSAVARLVCDIVQKESDIPCMTIFSDALGRGESVEQTDNRIEAFVEMLSCA
ncbi:MAG: 2-hydroxyacyl-CoA dehydratase [Chloroflexi bacterium]|nr:2-hydroxyacyl-CoA dehydratase [Chloroflexota bacterium]